MERRWRGNEEEVKRKRRGGEEEVKRKRRGGDAVFVFSYLRLFLPLSLSLLVSLTL